MDGPVDFSEMDDKVTFWTEDEVGELTIDCEDPLFKNNANCLTYTNPNGDTYKSKFGSSMLAFIIPAALLLFILLVWIIFKLI